ncbi:MAG: hypothetical protein GKS00_02020 [Alphaproteobacteria bacterium]|nr:hypothetical protein [Alphaproteobacteria bacterium]
MISAPTLDQRLDALPPKTAAPFRQLLAAGHMAEALLATVLDAGGLAGERHRLLGFTVAFLHLRSQGVPVHDVIRMAKARRRRINLDWSARRWQLEHDRLSRAEALDRLTAENARYDVAEFEALLPAAFDGYLIRSSRRLGMEGLRQRHCVASYDTQLRTGRCAIASLLVGKRRWTVQLFATGNPEYPLRIGQIKTRFNEQPSKEICSRIHEMLGVALAPPVEKQVTDGTQRFTYLDTLQRLLPVLRQHGVEGITVSFDGSGDEGAIDDIRCDGATIDPRGVHVEIVQAVRRFEDGQWVSTRELHRVSIADAVHDLTDDYLEETSVDWYNNEGGYGNLLIDVARGTVTLDICVRCIQADRAFYSQCDIETGDEID